MLSCKLFIRKLKFAVFIKLLLLLVALTAPAFGEVFWNLSLGDGTYAGAGLHCPGTTWNHLAKGVTKTLKTDAGADTTLKARLWTLPTTKPYALANAHPLLAKGLEGHVVVAFHDLRPQSTVEVIVYVTANAEASTVAARYQLGTWREVRSVEASLYTHAALVPDVNSFKLQAQVVPASGRVTFLLADNPAARIAALQLRTADSLSVYTP